MEKKLILGLFLFFIITFLVWKFFNGFYKKENSAKMRKTWGAKMYYWHYIIMISGLVTVFIITIF